MLLASYPLNKKLKENDLLAEESKPGELEISKNMTDGVYNLQWIHSEVFITAE